jgi:hypothetical protein
MDTYTRRRLEIVHELSVAQEFARLQESRLNHTVDALSAIEKLVGAVRARFRAKGIPTADSRYLFPSPSDLAIRGSTNAVLEEAEPHAVDMNTDVSAAVLFRPDRY